MSEIGSEVQGENVQAHENTTQENTPATPQQDITQYQQSTITEGVEPNVIVVIHLPDINKDLEIGRYAVKSAWVKAKTTPIKGAMVYKLTLYCNGIEHSFEALGVFIEFKDKVVFKLTR
jgi:hypothetical protein